MTADKNFKRLVRARMEKTGESYTAARSVLVAARAELPAEPTVDEYPDLAGMSDDAVRAKTGHTWVEWVRVLDGRGAAQLDHAAIAALVQREWPDVGGWWAQTVTVGYERIRGIRVKGQKSTGDFAASKSKTFPVPVSVLYAAFASDERDTWMDASPVTRTASADRSMRLTWPDGTVVAAWFTDKGSDKSAVSIQHEKLDSPKARERAKLDWANRLNALASRLE